MGEIGWTHKEMELKVKIEDVLASLNIPHRTMLMESKVWQTVARWAEASPDNDSPDVGSSHLVQPQQTSSRAESPAENSRQNTPPPPLPPQTPSEESTPVANDDPQYAAAFAKEDTAFHAVLKNLTAFSSPPPPPDAAGDRTPPPPGEESMDCFDTFTAAANPNDDHSAHEKKEQVDDDKSQMDSLREEAEKHSEAAAGAAALKTEDDEVVAAPTLRPSEGEDVDAIVKEAMSDIVKKICSQQVDDSSAAHDTLEREDESMAPEVAPIAKADMDVATDGDREDEEAKASLMDTIRLVQAKAKQLIEDWKLLKEVFKIPKKELIKMRAEHEREADRAAMARSAPRYPGSYPGSSLYRSSSSTTTPIVHHHHSFSTPPKPFHSSYERSRPHRPESPTSTASKRERRVSRFDDQSGLLHLAGGALSREHRRQLFMLKASTEEEERKTRALLLQQHANKCSYLRLDPAQVPLFPQHPEYYFDDTTGQWTPMPDPFPKVSFII
jgi:hypothetical protein